MSPATITRPVARSRGQLSLDALAPPRPVSAATAAGPAPAPAGGTLDDLISGTWRELGAQRVVTCPVCTEPMRPVPGARGGHCGGCGASLG